MTNGEQRIIFFDGVCGLCNRSVDFIIRHDRTHRFRFAPLQGETAKIMIPHYIRSSLSTFVYYENGRLFTKSTAALRVLIRTRKLFLFLIFFFLVPERLRDYLYGIVASRRYSWFGRKENCRILAPNERKIFLP